MYENIGIFDTLINNTTMFNNKTYF